MLARQEHAGRLERPFFFVGFAWESLSVWEEWVSLFVCLGGGVVYV